MRLLGIVVTGMFVLCAAAVGQEDVLRPKGRTKPRADTLEQAASAVPAPSDSSRMPRASLVLAVEAGMQWNILHREMSGLYALSPATVLADGSGVSALGGLTVELRTRSPLRLGVRLLLEEKRTSNTRTDVTSEAGVVDPLTGQVVTYQTIGMDATTSSSVTMVTVMPYVGVSVLDVVTLSVGAVIQMPTTDVATTETQSIDPNQPFRFWDGQQFSSSRTVNSTEPVSPSPRYGLDFALSVPIRLTRFLELTPRLGFQWMLSSYTAAYGAVDGSRSYSLGAVPYSAAASTLNSLQGSLLLAILL